MGRKLTLNLKKKSVWNHKNKDLPGQDLKIYTKENYPLNISHCCPLYLAFLQKCIITWLWTVFHICYKINWRLSGLLKLWYHNLVIATGFLSFMFTDILSSKHTIRFIYPTLLSTHVFSFFNFFIVIIFRIIQTPAQPGPEVCLGQAP